MAKTRLISKITNTEYKDQKTFGFDYIPFDYKFNKKICRVRIFDSPIINNFINIWFLFLYDADIIIYTIDLSKKK